MVNRNEKINITAEEERQLWILLSEAQRLMVAAAEKELKPLGITLVQSGVLYVLHTMKKQGIPSTPAEIARWLSRRPITVSALLNRMERQGLVLQRRDVSRKRIQVEMTDRGRQVYLDMVMTRKAVPSILGSLSPNQRKQMKTNLEKITQKAHLFLLEPPY